MADAQAFTKLVPGFDFLQGLVKNASSTLPNIGQWVAPTLNTEELEKRIDELRTVQFWLEQNARMLGATIQALEVQRMTLSTLKTMNVHMDDLRESLQVRVPAASPPARDAGHRSKPPSRAASETARGASSEPGAVDPMQWWGALTKQFTQLAASAMKDSVAEAVPERDSAAARQGADAAAQTVRKATAAPSPPRKKSGNARKRAADSER